MSEGADARSTSGGDGSIAITAAAIAVQVEGRVIGDVGALVCRIAPLDRAGPDELSFLAHSRYTSWFATSQAGVVLVSPDLADTIGRPATRIVVARPTEAMVKMLAHFRRPEARTGGIHPTAVIAPTAVIGADVSVDAYAVIGDGVSIGDGSWIGPHAVVGDGTIVGRHVRIHAGATAYAFVELGDRVTLHAGARVGRDGFGFIPGPNGPVRIPHLGRCVLEHDVEVGANSCVDRGSVDDTIIGAGTKLDNLVHVAHNVRIGKGCFLAAQVGIAGSTRIGDGVQFGGQAGAGGHANIGSGATVAARAGAIADVLPGETVSGFPARKHRDQQRSLAALNRLAKIIRPLEQLLDAQDAP